MKPQIAVVLALLALLNIDAEAKPPARPGAKAPKPKPLAQNTCSYERETGRIEAFFSTSGELVWRLSCFGERCTAVAINTANIAAGRPMVAADVSDFGRLPLQAENTAKMITGTDAESNKLRAELQEIMARVRPFVTTHEGLVIVSVPPDLSFIIEPRGAIVARIHADDMSVTSRELIECRGSTKVAD
jgi:hypothetical protein